MILLIFVFMQIVCRNLILVWTNGGFYPVWKMHSVSSTVCVWEDRNLYSDPIDHHFTLQTFAALSIGRWPVEQPSHTQCS